MKRAIILLSVLGLLLGGCSSDGDKKSEAKTTTTVRADDTGSDSAPEADGALKARLLVVGDLPSDFIASSEAVEVDPEKAPTATSPYCKELDRAETAVLAQRGAKAEFINQTGANTGRTISERLGRFGTESKAKASFAAFKNGFESCPSFTDEDSASKTTGGFKQTDFPSVGDQTYVAKLTLSNYDKASKETARGDGLAVVVRKGQHVMLVFFVAGGVDPLPTNQIEAIVNAGAAKI